MLSRSNSISLSLRSHEGTMLDLEQQIRLLDADEITPLRTKIPKKLKKINDEIEQCNFLLNAGIGSKNDLDIIRQTKRELRQRRIKLWAKLEALPALEEERRELVTQLLELRRRHGILEPFL